MKKAYISPEFQFSDMEAEQLMVFSADSGFNLDDAPETTETVGNLSRGSVWDDADLEDEGL